MLRLGFEPSFMVYNGTANRSRLWWDAENEKFKDIKIAPGLNRHDLDWSLEGNFCDPFEASTALGCVKLARNPWAFGANLPPYRAIVLDIESTSTYNQSPSSPSQGLKVIQEWSRMFDLFRAGGLSCELYSYMDPGFFPQWRDRWDLTSISPFERECFSRLEEADQKMMRKLSGMNVSLYNWDITLENPGLWYSGVDSVTSLIDTYYPYHSCNKFACIHPWFDVYHPHHIQDLRNSSKAGTLMPLDRWKRQVRYLVDRGWHLYPWTPHPVKPIKPYLDEVARYSF
jgi:hypothetical protein